MAGEKFKSSQRGESPEDRINRVLTRELLNRLPEETFREMIIQRYKVLFGQMMEPDNLLSKNDRETFQILETQIIKTVLENDICLVACILINVDIIIILDANAVQNATRLMFILNQINNDEIKHIISEFTFTHFFSRRTESQFRLHMLE